MNSCGLSFEKPQVRTLAKLRLAFEPAGARAEHSTEFLARGNSFEMMLDPRGATFVTASKTGASPSPPRAWGPAAPNPQSVMPQSHYSTIRMTLANGARPSRGEASARLKGVVNYYGGRDRSKWQSGVPTFGRVRYREIYPGIDLVYHGENGRFEFDFEVAPGARPAKIALALDGAKKITLQVDGGVDIDSGTGTIRLQTPVAYQEIGGMHRIVPARYQVADASTGAKGVKKAAQISIALGAYDHSHAVVIDPTLVFATYPGFPSCKCTTNLVRPCKAVDRRGFRCERGGAEVEWRWVRHKISPFSFPSIAR